MTLPTKKQTLQVITGIGGILAGLGTLPVASESLPMPPEWRPYLLSVGFFAMASRQWLGVVTDIFDNGKADSSYKFDP
jgi:hypothetical protein